MASLMFRCPKTGNEIDTGIDADEDTRRTLDILICRVSCPHCRFDHFPQIKRGKFETLSFACEPLPAQINRLLGKLGSSAREP